MRCFLAVPLGEPALGEAQRVLATLRDRVAGVRWVRPETLHLTLHFFGEIEDARAFSAVEIARPVVTSTAPFDVELDTLGAFPPRGAPRVLWIGCSREPDALAGLVLRCRDALRRAGLAVEDRPHRAHCTLGRPRSRWPRDAFDAWRMAIADPLRPMRFTATRMVLYDSRSTPGGAVHTVRALIDLAAA